MKPFMEYKKQFNFRNFRFDIVIIFVVLLLTLVYQQQRLNYLVYDVFLNKINAPAPNHTAIIEVDDRSLVILGEWPWDRDVHAELLEKLESYQVKAVGFDILFIKNNHSSDEQDQLFSEAISKAKNVVLPIAPSKSMVGGIQEIFPQPSLAKHAEKLGHVDFELDEDGIIRRGFLYAGFQSSRWPSFGLALAEVANSYTPIEKSAINHGTSWTRRDTTLINYNVPHGQTRLDHYSYIDVLAGNIDKSKLKNKIILVGMNASALGDQFATPISTAHTTMPGVEINAHFVNTVVNNNKIKLLSTIELTCITIVLLLITMLHFYRVKAKQLFTALVLQTGSSLILSACLFSLFLIWFPPVILIICQILLFTLANMIKNSIITKHISQLNYNLEHDYITGLLNNQGIKNYFKRNIAHDLDWMLFRVQVGKLNGISELIGKDANQTLLNEIKQRLETILPNDHQGLARIHEYEYAFILPLFNDKERNTLCDELIHQLSHPYSISTSNLKMPVNIGVSISKSTNNIDNLLANAQAALKYSQENPLSSFCVYSQKLKNLLDERIQIESDLSQALENNELEIYYQPQVATSNKKIIGAEALIRWNHPTKGIISPAIFIPVAENTGMIIEIGRWILEEACKQTVKWQHQGFESFRIAVNLSPVQFSQPNLIQQVKNALETTNLDSKHLELELTESGILEDINATISMFKELKQLGVSLSIDDFGTGYSSLSYLKQFPIDRIKIDRSFITEVTDNKDSQEITLAIISMAHSLNMTVIAEGIESEQQYEFLHKNKCEELQGFYFGKPAKASALEELLHEQPTYN